MSDASLSTALLTPILLGGAGTLLGIFGLVVRPSRWGAVWLVLQGVLGAGLVGLAVINATLGYSRSLWMAPGVLGGLLLVLGPLALVGHWGMTRRLVRLASWRPAQAVLLLAATTSLAAWQTFEADLQPEEARDRDLVILAPDDLSLQPADVAAWTDAGRPVSLFRPSSQEAGEMARRPEADSLMLAAPELHEKVLRVGPADVQYNCHGWVFTGGRAWLRGDQVPAILQDNGYVPTSQPQEDDLVVYYEPGGEVLHSGIVRVVWPDAPPVVESKWGWAGRFLHPAAIANYCRGEYQYYHSPRESHLLKGLGGEAKPLPAASPSPAASPVPAASPSPAASPVPAGPEERRQRQT